MRKKGLGFLILVLLAGALVGTAVGEVIALVLPAGVVKDFFLRSVTIGMQDPITLNLTIITLVFGLSFKINIISVLGIILVAYFLKWYN